MSKDFAIAVSRFGLTLDQFLQLTPLEFWLAIKDKDEYELSKIKPVCEAIRMQTWWLYNVAADRRSKIRKKERLMAFPWDKERELKKPQTREEMKDTMKLMASGKRRKGMGVRERRLHKEKLRQERLQQQRDRNLKPK